MFEHVNCNICGSENYKIIFPSTIKFFSLKPETVAYETKEHHQIVQCVYCGLVYANFRDNSKELSKTYRKLGGEEYLEEVESRLITSKKYLEIIRKYTRGNTLLDVGCSVGLFLKNASDNYWRAYGIEKSEITSRIARENFGLNVVTGDIYDACFESDFFDVITLWDVIEHIINPKKMLYELNRIQKPNGYLFIATPNIDSLVSNLLGSKWMHLIRTHLFYFSKITIKKILEETGYQIVGISSYKRVFRIGYIVNRIRPHSIKIHSILNIFVKLLNIRNIRIPINLLDCMFVVAKK